MALLLRPLALIEPPWIGALIWFFAKVVMALLALAGVFRLVESGGTPFPPWAKAVATLLSLGPIVGDLSHGNVNIFILFLVIAALYAWHKECDLLAGVLLALAVCCKVTPALFVPYFLWKRQWKLLAGWAVGMAVFILALPALYLGWDENWKLLTSWIDQMIVPFVVRGEVTSEHPNQSLPGVMYRLLTHSPSFIIYPNNVWTPAEYHNLFDIGRDGARWLIRTAQAVFALLVVLTCRAKGRGGWRVGIELGVILIGMLLFSERTWKHHCVTLMLPFSVVVYALVVVPMSRWIKVTLIGLLGATSLLMLSASGILSVRGADLMMVYGVYTWAFISLLVALIAANGFGKENSRPTLHGDNRSLTQPVLVAR